MTINKPVPVVTVDGPSGSGKGTISQRLASELGWHFLDSGALYRVLALAAKSHAVSLENAIALRVLAGHLDVQFVTKIIGAIPRIILEGNDVTDDIRNEEISQSASRVAAYPGVRTALLDRQRAFREAPGLVTDGRDMGTVVFPDASVKIFLMASPEERAKRRYFQLKQMGIDANLDQIKDEMIERDLRDKDRAVAPLKPAEDAVTIDTTGLSIELVLQKVKEVMAVKGVVS